MQKVKSQPKNWRKAKLGDILELKYGFGLPEKNRKSGNVPVYGSSGIVGTHSEAAVKSPGIIIGRKGHVGSVHFSDRSFYPIDTVYYVDELEKEGDLKFFYYFLQRMPFQKIGSDVGVPGLNREIAYGLDIIIPENPNEQKRIASILSAFDDKIELNNKINQTLEKIAQAIFKEWLLKSQKSKVKSQKLDKFIDIISGYPFSSKLYVNDKKAFGVVTIKNVQDGNFIATCDSFIKEDDIPQNMNQECILKNGDILLSLTGNVGRICFVYGGKYLLNQRVAKLKPKNEKDHAFCYFLFRQKSMQNQLINMAKGSAQPNLSPIETGKIELPIPSRDVLDKFSKLITPIYEQLIKNMSENQKLSALRDLLLPKLMSGEIRV